MVISVTGQPVSGKDTVADYLVSKGFSKISMGDILREEMRKKGISTTRENMCEYAINMRQQYGNRYPAGEVVRRITGNTVISGIRNTEEMKVFVRKFGKQFKLIAVEAPIETRYRWAQQRGRVGDHISFEQFKEEEEKERSTESGSHEVDAVIAMADVVIKNDRTQEDLFRKVDEYLESHGK